MLFKPYPRRTVFQTLARSKHSSNPPLRAPFLRHQQPRQPQTNFSTSTPLSNGPTTTTTNPPHHLQALHSLSQKYPKLSPLLTAPVSHVASFLILHELTAIIPLGGLFWLLHTLNLNLNPPSKDQAHHHSPSSSSPSSDEPNSTFTTKLHQKWNTWVESGSQKFTKYAIRKQWISDDESLNLAANGTLISSGTKAGRIILELATSYAVVKLLLPVRIGLSLWATPWFARVVFGGVGKMFRRKK